MKRRHSNLIDLSVQPSPLSCSDTHHMKVLIGAGREDYPFDDEQTMVRRCVEDYRCELNGSRSSEKDQSDTLSGAEQLFVIDGSNIMDPNATPGTPGGGSRSPLFQALVRGADGVQAVMIPHQFDFIHEQLFGSMEGTFKWGANHMEPDYRPKAAGFLKQLTTARSRFAGALPALLKEMEGMNPGVPRNALLQKAVQLLVKDLGAILGILSVCANAIGQYRDGRWDRQLRAINWFLKQNFYLFQTGDLHGMAAGQQHPQLPRSVFQVDDLYLSAFGPGGLGTMPGSKGEVGIHVTMLPFDFDPYFPLGLSLLLHEGWHQIFHNVVGMADERRKAAYQSILTYHKRGQLVLASKKTEIAGELHPTEQVFAKWGADCVGEMDSDLAAVLGAGESFGWAALNTFPGMTIRDGRVKDAVRLIRTNAVFRFRPLDNNRKGLVIGPHPDDWSRQQVIAAVLEEIGYPEKAAEHRQLADDCAGGRPKVVTLMDADEKSDLEFSLASQDVEACCVVLAKTLVNKKMVSLGQQCIADRFKWGKRQVYKAGLIADRLYRGVAQLPPPEEGDFFAPYFSAGAALAHRRAMLDGKDGAEFLPQLTEALLTMMEEAMDRFRKK